MTRSDELSPITSLDAVIESVNKFSSPLIKYVVEEKPGNVIWSPLTAAVTLAMIGYGARKQTESQFKKVLHLPSPTKLAQVGYRELIRIINTMHENKLFITHKVFLPERFIVKQYFKEVTEIYFRSATEMVDFSKAEEAAKTINAWIKESTDNVISDVISKDDLNAATKMIVVNAMYLRIPWDETFDSSQTERRPFYINKDTTKDVPTMFREGLYKYGELPDLDAKLVEIPYKGGELNMVFIVPNEICGLPALLTKLENESLINIVQRGSWSDVDLYLPKFTLESQVELTNPLRKMNLIYAFDGRANFGGICNAWTYINKAVQKVYIEVDEEGSKVIPSIHHKPMPRPGRGPLRPQVVFKVDRPSFYAIYHNGHRLLLANGILMEP